MAGDGVAQVVWEDEDGPLKHPHHPRGASRGRQVCCDIPGLNSRSVSQSLFIILGWLLLRTGHDPLSSIDIICIIIYSLLII